MKFLVLILGFAVIAHVKCQLYHRNRENFVYEEEDDEEDDQDAVTTTTTTTTPAPVQVNVRQRQEVVNIPTFPPLIGTETNISSTDAMELNHTFALKPANDTFFGAVVESSAPAGATTPRVHYVLNQVGSIWNNVGKLNVSGIVDQALGIRNNRIARPIVTGILNFVLCNPLTFSNNNCLKS